MVRKTTEHSTIFRGSLYRGKEGSLCRGMVGSPSRGISGSLSAYSPHDPVLITEKDLFASLLESQKKPDKIKLNTPLGLVEYSEKCIVKNDDSDFDLFFALQFYFADMFEGEHFLNYHLINTFDNDYQWYKRFLENLSIKYKSFLEDKHTTIIEHFFADNKDLKNTFEGNKTISNDKQILAIKCLLEVVFELSHTDITLVQQTKIAEFIRAVTQIEIGNKSIRSTNLYDTVRESNVLMRKTKGKAIAEWEHIKSEFEKISLKVAIDKVDAILNEIKNRKK
jgi:hypothetical protein